MELLLTDKDIWDIISEARPAAPDAAWLKRNGKARAKIGLMVMSMDYVIFERKKLL